jgi:tetratricopeptide (TPR) repeat protein
VTPAALALALALLQAPPAPAASGAPATPDAPAGPQAPPAPDAPAGPHAAPAPDAPPGPHAAPGRGGQGATTPASGDPAARFAAANRLHDAGDFEGAARAYGALLGEGLESPALHVNLGSARFRAGRRGAALASLERALRLDPRDADARADLAAVRATDPDRLAAAPERSLLARIAERTPDAWAAAAFAFPWAALFAALAFRTRARPPARRALGAGAALAALLSAGGAALVLAREAARSAPTALVVVPEAAVRDGPEEALRPAFRLREGAAVTVVETRGDAERVRLPNGLEGWVSARDLERL